MYTICSSSEREPIHRQLPKYSWCLSESTTNSFTLHQTVTTTNLGKQIASSRLHIHSRTSVTTRILLQRPWTDTPDFHAHLEPSHGFFRALDLTQHPRYSQTPFRSFPDICSLCQTSPVSPRSQASQPFPQACPMPLDHLRFIHPYYSPLPLGLSRLLYAISIPLLLSSRTSPASVHLAQVLLIHLATTTRLHESRRSPLLYTGLWFPNSRNVRLDHLDNLHTPRFSITLSSILATLSVAY